ncbi:MAG: 30S ribosomal protein S6 [Candidatus Poribacteria bacterium]|nr:30S ribosomal protein S6 [Candidatus Poribacteria bacterium]
MQHYIPTRTYETVFILRPTLSETEVDEYVTAVKTLIAQNENEVVKVDLWGRRKLAYPIRRYRDGVFVYMIFTGKPAFVTELNRQYQITEDIIRFLTVVVEGEIGESTGINDAPARDSRRGGRDGDRDRDRRDDRRGDRDDRDDRPPRPPFRGRRDDDDEGDDE